MRNPVKKSDVIPAKAGIHLDLALAFTFSSKKKPFSLCASHFSLNGKEK
jgi:hypothetical protein